MLRRLSTLAAILATLLAAKTAQAAVDCNTLPNVVYMQIGDTQEPLIKTIGKKLRDSAVMPMTLVYNLSGSCTNIDAIYNGTKLTVNPKYMPSIAEDPTWDPTKPSVSCNIDPAGADLDIANSNVFISACTNMSPPMGIGAVTGPIQGYAFVVPETSTQTAINADEAYFVFGFGANGMQGDPWIDPTFFYIRPPTKSTIVSLAAAIGVPAAKWQGQQLNASSMVLNSLATSADPEASIGILGVEIYDNNRTVVNALAYRGYGQKYAYYPDKTSTSFEKQNVRDGHYLPWSPTVYMAHVDANNVPTNPNVKYVFALITNKQAMPAPDFSPIDAEIANGLVPDCAMKVSRQVEAGDLSLYQPAEPCGCYFEDKTTGMGGKGCTHCKIDGDCNAGKCRYGYCEAQ